MRNSVQLKNVVGSYRWGKEKQGATLLMRTNRHKCKEGTEW